jgi:DNA-binding NarL/FixJ family response regulator
MIPVHLLLVEDNASDARLVTRRLESTQLLRCRIDTADYLNTALMLARNKSFDLVLLDLSLPDSIGIDTIVSMRREVPTTPIIVLSAQEDLQVATRAMEVGADTFIVKRPELSTDELEREIIYSLERGRRMTTARSLMQSSLAGLSYDDEKKTSSTLFGSAHVNKVDDAVSMVRMFLQKNNPAIAEQVEQSLHANGYYIAIQELRSLLRMDQNIHTRKTASISERALSVVRESASATKAKLEDPESELLDALQELEAING